MEQVLSVVGLSEFENVLFRMQSKSGARGLYVVWRLSVSRRVRYGRFHCNHFIMHSCCCRFSRRIMWLKLATTNQDPAVILGYFLECISDTKSK